MQVGDLVKSWDPWEKVLGTVVEVVPGRVGEDGIIRETKVYWFQSNKSHPNYTWAITKGLEVISASR